MSSIDGKEKEMIDIKYIYDRLYNVSSLCLDFFHEGIRYRQRDLTGGKKKQKENLVDIKNLIILTYLLV